MPKKPSKPAEHYNSAADKKAIEKYFGDDWRVAKGEWEKKLSRWKRNYDIVDFPFKEHKNKLPSGAYVPQWSENKPLVQEHNDLVDESDKTKIKIPKAFFYKQLALTKLQPLNFTISTKALEPRYVENQKATKRVMDFTYHKEQVHNEYAKAVNDAILYGNAFLKECMVREKRKVKVYDDEKWQAEAREKGVSLLDITDIPFKEVEVDGWMLKTVYCSTFNIFPAPSFSLDKCPHLFEVDDYNIDQFHAIFDGIYPKARFVTEDHSREKDSEKEKEPNNDKFPEDHKVVRVIQRWDRINDLWLIWANGILLTSPKNPIPYTHKILPNGQGGLPFIQLSYEKIASNDFWGRGLPEIIEHVIEEMNTERRMRLDHLKDLLRPQTAFNESHANEEDFGYKYVPLDVPLGQDIRSVFAPIPQTPIRPETFQETALLERECMEVLGLFDSSNQKYASATGAAQSMQKVNERFDLIRQDWEKELRKLALMRFSNVKQYYGKEPKKVEEVIGEDELKRLKEENGLTGLSEKELYQKNILEKMYVEEEYTDEEGEQQTRIAEKEMFNHWGWISYENEKGVRNFDLLSPDICQGEFEFDVSLDPIANKSLKVQQTMGLVQAMGMLFNIYPELKANVKGMTLLEWVVEAHDKNFGELETDDGADVVGEAEALREEDKFRLGKIEPADRQATMAHIQTHQKEMPETIQILQQKFPENLEVYMKHIQDEQPIAEKNSGVKAQQQQPQGQPGQPPGGPGGAPPGQPGRPPQQETMPGSGAPLPDQASMAEQGGVPIA